MHKGPIIDHDPNEGSSTTGETIAVTVGTTVVLIGLGFLLNYVFKSQGYAVGLATCAVATASLFALAFWLERLNKRRRG